MREVASNQSSEQGSENIGNAIAKRIEDLLDDAARNERVMSRFLIALRNGGIATAKVFCWNESDKFRIQPDGVIAVIERDVFGAGESRIDAETPWNMSRRRDAKRKRG